MACNQAAGGCNYPEGKSIAEIWPNGHGLEIVFNDGSSLIFMAPFAFKPAPTDKSGGVK